jgi:uncharacterized protein YndB with AHSA1/START domain
MMITIVVIAVAVALAAVLAYAASKPDNFTVQRSTVIAAPPEHIFPLIDDLHAQSAWSPFEKDPAMKRTHSGPARGPGAVYAWDGDRRVGAGQITVTESMPPSKVVLALRMARPLKADNIVEFTLQRASGAGTRVTWTMRGKAPFMAKVMGLFMNCDNMVGTQFDEGLAKLKTLVETQRAPMAAE